MNKKLSFFLRFFPYVIKQYLGKECQKNAAALTYMTLFAIVPMLTVIFSVFSMVPAFQSLGGNLQEMMFSNLLPETGVEVQEYLVTFMHQARSLSWVGVLFLFGTAYFMLRNIEKAFNSIWGVLKPRSGLPSFLIYWAILSLGPLLLGIGLAVSGYLVSLQLVVTEYDQLGILKFLRFFPLLLSTTIFTLIFTAVPNCRVPFKHALAGGFATAFCFELLKAGFGLLMSYNASVGVIYGAFAAVPIFLMWIYISWMIVLGGAVMVRSLTAFKVVASGRRHPDLVAALLVLWTFHQRLERGNSLSVSSLWKLGLDVDQWQLLRVQLLKHKVIAVTSTDRYVLCRDLNHVTLRQLADIIDMPTQMPGVCDYLHTFSWFSEVGGRLLAVDQFIDEQFDITVGELFAVELESDEGVYPDEGEGLEMLEEELAKPTNPGVSTPIAPLIQHSRVGSLTQAGQYDSDIAEDDLEEALDDILEEPTQDSADDTSNESADDQQGRKHSDS